MKTFSIGRKLLVSYTVILVLMSIGFGVSIFNLINLNSKMEVFYKGPFVVNESANVIYSNFERMQKATYRTIVNTDEEIIREAMANALDSANVIRNELPVVRKHFLGDPQIIDRLEDCLNRLTPMREHVLSLAHENKNKEAAAYMEENNIQVIGEAQKELDKLIESGNSKGLQLMEELRERQVQAILILGVVGVVSIIISLCFGVFISKGISRGIRELEQAARNIAAGRLSAVRIIYESGDEMGNLADDMRSMATTLTTVIRDETYLLNEMAEGNFDINIREEDSYVGELDSVRLSLDRIISNLRDTLLQISQSAEQVAAGSEQVSSGAVIQAQGATEQAASIESLFTAISDISKQVENNVKKAKEVSGQSETVHMDAEDSRGQMQDMLSAMAEIRDSSKTIERIIKTIEDIAFQTNILALNAAVEAARAGAAGKGFAVVADEVRNLAAKSSEAAQNTTVLIENTLKLVEKGVTLTGNTMATLKQVGKGAMESTDMVDEIAAASARQQEILSQFTESIHQISEVIQSNMNTAETTSTASEELREHARSLESAINQFKLRQ